MKDFAQVCQAIVHDVLKHDPIDATWAGVHEYDAASPDLSLDGFADDQTRAAGHLATLQQWQPDQLKPQELIDWRLLVAHFESELRELREVQPQRHDPSLYPGIAISAIYSLLARDYAPLSDRLPALEARLKALPGFLQAARANLLRSPRIWTEIAIEETEGGAEFLKDTVGVIAAEQPRLQKPLQEALEASAGYAEFLRTQHIARDGMPFAVGRELFDFKLQHELLLDEDSGSLLRFGEEAVRSTQEQMTEVAGSIDAKRSWAELIEAFRRELPPEETLLSEYRAGVTTTRQFVVDRNLVSIPSGESLQVVETPVFMRPTVPYAAYMPAGSFEHKQEGLYYVTPVNASLPAEERAEQLLGHNRFGMLLTNVHEGYPGHHLQLALASRVESPVRKLLSDTVFCEGWALYCEQLVLDEGLSTDPRVRLFQLKDQLWRACRVVIDVKLHTGEMSFDEAVAMLVDVAHLERPNAIGEVRRYTHEPTQPLSYLTGKRQIMRLRDREKSRLGSRFDLRSFHDRLLSYGTIPVALIEPTFAQGR